MLKSFSKLNKTTNDVHHTIKIKSLSQPFNQLPFFLSRIKLYTGSPLLQQNIIMSPTTSKPFFNSHGIRKISHTILPLTDKINISENLENSENPINSQNPVMPSGGKEDNDDQNDMRPKNIKRKLPENDEIILNIITSAVASIIASIIFALFIYFLFEKSQKDRDQLNEFYKDYRDLKDGFPKNIPFQHSFLPISSLEVKSMKPENILAIIRDLEYHHKCIEDLVCKTDKYKENNFLEELKNEIKNYSNHLNKYIVANKALLSLISGSKDYEKEIKQIKKLIGFFQEIGGCVLDSNGSFEKFFEINDNENYICDKNLSIVALYNLEALFYRKINNIAEAIKSFESGIEIIEKILSLETDDDNLDIYQSKSNVNAIKFLSDILKINLSVSCIESGRIEKAKEYLTELYFLDHLNDPEYLNAKGLISLLDKDYFGAKIYFEKAISQDQLPSSKSIILCNLATTYTNNYQYDHALTCIKISSEIDPYNLNTLFLKAVCEYNCALEIETKQQPKIGERIKKTFFYLFTDTNSDFSPEERYKKSKEHLACFKYLLEKNDSKLTTVYFNKSDHDDLLNKIDEKSKNPYTIDIVSKLSLGKIKTNTVIKKEGVIQNIMSPSF